MVRAGGYIRWRFHWLKKSPAPRLRGGMFRGNDVMMGYGFQ